MSHLNFHLICLTHLVKINRPMTTSQYVTSMTWRYVFYVEISISMIFPNIHSTMHRRIFTTKTQVNTLHRYKTLNHSYNYHNRFNFGASIARNTGTRIIC